MRLSLLALAATAALALALPAQATITIYAATLNGASEATPNLSPGVGTATITFDDVLSTMRVQTTFSGLMGNVTAAHIHCCTAVAGVATAGVATVMPAPTGFPLGAPSGSYDGTLNMLAVSGSWNAAFVTANGGTQASAFTALMTGVAAGKAYLNIHSTTFGGGEIRGFLTPVPEPTSAALLLGGLALLGAATRRRRG